MSLPPAILVVEDDASILDAVASALRYEGFEVREAASGSLARVRIAEREPDLIVLDWMLPDASGIELGRELRADGSQIPILFLSARDATEDKLQALGIGADDYVTKPFSLDEVIARVRALLRRSAPGTADALHFAGVTLRESRRTVLRGAEAIELTDTEFALLRYFLLHPGALLSKAQILENVWLNDFDGSPDVVETYVGSLSRKLGQGGSPLIRHEGRDRYVLAEA